jgi:outer membrane protein assembly factor BamB
MLWGGPSPIPSEPKALPFFPTRAAWSVALNNPLAETPVYDATRAYVPIAGDRLVAYDLKTGALAWTVTAGPAMPLATGDDLIFVTEKDALVALRASDGSLAWRLPLEQPLGEPPVWDNGWLVLASATGTIEALRARDGRSIWRHAVGAAPHARPALSADRVYVPVANAHVVALHVATGEQVWDRRLGGDPNEILALDDRIFVGSKDNYLYCLNAATGVVEWRWRTGADVIGVPAYDDDLVFFVSLDNVVRALSRRSGVQHWMRQLTMRPTAGPIRAGATVIAVGLASSLPTFNAKDGTPVGSLPATPELAAPPHLVIDPDSGLPTVVMLTKDLSKALATTLTMMMRGLDPSPVPFSALPSSITTLPSASPADSAGPRGQTPD